MNNRVSRKILAVLTILVLTFSLIACGSKKNKVVGAWLQSNSSEVKDEYTFNADRTGTYTNTIYSMSTIDFTYTIEGETISIVMKILGEDTINSYNYKLDGDTLTMTIDGKDVAFQKK